MNLRYQGSGDFVEDAAQTFHRIKQPFCVVALNGTENYHVRAGGLTRQDIQDLKHVVLTKLLPVLDRLESRTS